MQPTPEQLNRLVECIRDAVQPLRIILFGSAARGEMRADSDIDVAVVMPDGTDPHDVYAVLYPRFVDFDFSVDVIVTTPTQLNKYRSSIGMVYRDIVRDGRDLYAA
ncbi:MAG TPA: nucleotidyltransferase domain-containing protein [Armatimonadota bacterium]|nr:nucleotidyltransferase domain-containing protein [Armatimonadota bacterium]